MCRNINNQTKEQHKDNRGIETTKFLLITFALLLMMDHQNNFTET
jgi:hypothetical protein